jgi:hypothetical protein
VELGLASLGSSVLLIVKVFDCDGILAIVLGGTICSDLLLAGFARHLYYGTFKMLLVV